MSFDPESYTITIHKENCQGESLYAGRVAEFPNISAFESTFDVTRAVLIDAIRTLKRIAEEAHTDFPLPYVYLSNGLSDSVALLSPPELILRDVRAPLIVYIDMDDVMCDYRTAFKLKRAEHQFPQSIPGFFESLTPIDGAIESVKRLIASHRHDPYILTAPSTRNPLSYAEKRIWIEKYFGYQFTKKLIISSNKGLLRGDILIDDLAQGKGQEHFHGKLIQFGSVNYPGWTAVNKFLFGD